jgi:hypothetical protein
MSNPAQLRFLKVITFLALLAFLAGSQAALAKPRSASEANAAVKTWLQTVLADGRPDAAVIRIDPYQHEGQTVAFIVHLAGEGFCLTGADDLSRPVVFYCPDSPYEPDNPGLQYLLEEIRDSYLAVREIINTGGAQLGAIQEELDRQAELWSDLVAGRKPAPRDLNQDLNQDRVVPDLVVLPLTSKWHQNSPYNDDCPSPDGPPHDNIPSKVGCVATAMSQTMYYWKWPSRGDGSRQVWWPVHVFDGVHSTTLQDDPGINASVWAGRLQWTDSFSPPLLQALGTWDGSMWEEAWDISTDTAFRNALSALRAQSLIQFQVVESDFTTSFYNWDQMQDEHWDSDGLDAGDAQAAMLCFDAGVANDMNWGRYSSTSQTSDVPSRMAAFFRYDSDINFGWAPSSLMREEISWFRPLILRGSNSSGGGHAWVVFGYDYSAGLDLFRMNMGWGASAIGWYLRNSVPSGYNTDQGMVSRIAPLYSVRFVAEEGLFGDGTPSNPYNNLAEALTDAPDDVTLVFQAGSTHLLTGTAAVLNTPHVYKGTDVLLIHQ